MPTIAYVPKNFNAEHQQIIEHANEIINRFAGQGYDLTLRQLYYQFVSRDLFPQTWADATTNSTNNERSYKKLGTIVSDARRAGLIDWDRIVDRTRNVRTPPAWAGPESIVRACASQFSIDWWEHQPYRPEVWVEKDALVGVLEVACEPWHCPYFSCRGYVSDSEAWAAAQRFDRAQKHDQIPIVFHLGDHDPSGIDMSRDIRERVNLFNRSACRVEVRRLALTMGQVDEVGPPPNPAKVTDSRFAAYQEQYGDESWELDALDPEYITNLIATEMQAIVDDEAWQEAGERQEEGRRLLGQVSEQWEELTGGL